MEKKKIQFEKFPLGFWPVYPYDISGLNENEIADLVDCGMTLTLSPDTSHEKVEDTLKALDLCQKYGLKLILVDKRTLWNRVQNGEENYRADMRQAYEDFGRHPATAGFFLGDEPSEWQLQECLKAFRIAAEECHGLIPFINHYAGFADGCHGFVIDSDCPLLSFDRYSQMNPEKEGVDDYFDDLIAFKAIAEEANCPMLTIILSVGHYRYRVPNVDELRWQMNTSIACGSNAIFWFTYHTPITYCNYRGAPISEFGEKNPTWYALKDIQRKFNKDYANLINHLDFRGAYWFEKNYGKMKPFASGNLEDSIGIPVVGIDTPHNVAGIISYFEGRDEYAGKKYVMMTNNSWSESDAFHMTFKPSVKNVYQCYSDKEVDFIKYHPDAIFQRDEDVVHVCTYLAPGQFAIFRVEE